MVGLNNVDHTTDLDKPVSTATQTALNLKAPLANPKFTGQVTHSWCSVRLYGTGTIARSFGHVSIINSNVDITGGSSVYKITMPSTHPLATSYGVIGNCNAANTGNSSNEF